MGHVCTAFSTKTFGTEGVLSKLVIVYFSMSNWVRVISGYSYGGISREWHESSGGKGIFHNFAWRERFDWGGSIRSNCPGSIGPLDTATLARRRIEPFRTFSGGKGSNFLAGKVRFDVFGAQKFCLWTRPNVDNANTRQEKGKQLK